MRSALVQEFQARIVTASRSDLVVINYEMLMAELDEAIEFIEGGDNKRYHDCMSRARKLLNELMINLDFSYDISRELMSLYVYVNKRFIEASQVLNSAPLHTAQEILGTLLVGWKEANKSEDNEKAPLIQNGQQLYAGLTYGKGSLNETVYNQQGRGYRA